MLRRPFYNHRDATGCDKIVRKKSPSGASQRKYFMSKATQTIREKVHALAEELPADASWDDVIEEARFRKAVELGIAAADRGTFASDEEVRNAFGRWGVKT